MYYFNELELNTSLQMNELEKKRKKRFSKYITEGG